MLEAWNFVLVIGAFSLTILGTFLTRSGVIASVHSFTQSAIGPRALGVFGGGGGGLVRPVRRAFPTDLLSCPA